MRTADAAVLTALEQARTFIDTHRDHLDQLESAGYRHKLDDVIAALKQLSVEQDGADRISDGQLARKQALRAALRLNHIAPIAAIAAARLRDIPEFAAFRMPLYRAKTTALVIAAHAMAKAARPYAPTFIEGGLPHDFAEQLEAAATALAETLTDRESSLVVRAGASAGLRTEASRGRHVLRVLSSLIEPRLKGNESLLAGWRSARHIQRPAKSHPVLFPLLGVLARAAAESAQTTDPDAPHDMAEPTAAQLALPPAPIPETFVNQTVSPPSSAFSRVAQIMAGDGDEAPTIA